jgi:excinuclease ABC subunit C
MESLDRLGISERVKVISIAKRLEEIYRPGDPVPVYLDKNSQTLKLIQQLRNEAHRFAISFHRNNRSKQVFVSVLHKIEGIGTKSIDGLLAYFKSVERLKKAKLEDIARVIGKDKAIRVKTYLEKENYNID